MSEEKRQSAAQTDEQREIIDRLRAYGPEERELLKKHGVSRNLTITFPGRKRIPLLGRLGVKIINLAGGMMDATYRLRKD